MLKYALIGCGRIAKNHINAALAQSDLEINAVCDVVPERMDAILTLMPEEIRNGVRKYENYQELLDNEHPELCAIATDSGVHAEIGMHCISSGSHCILEKPMAMSLRDADALIAAAKEHNRILSVCHQNRYNKSVQKIRKALDDGRFGKLSHIAAHVRWNRDEDYYKQASWRGTWANDGGCLMSQCIHNADLMIWFLGDIEEVFAYTQNMQHPYIKAEDLGMALVKAKGGALGLFEGTVNVFPKNLEETLYLFGENGTVKAAGTSVNLIEEWNFADPLDNSEAVKKEYREMPPNVYGFGHTPLYKDVINAIKTGSKPLIDGKEGKRALELVFAMYKSKKTGLPVRLPLGDFATTDMEGTF